MFLKADSAEMLVRLQLQTNVRLMGRADFTNIQFVNGFWYAWYLVDIDRYPELLKGIYEPKPGTRGQRTRKV